MGIARGGGGGSCPLCPCPCPCPCTDPALRSTFSWRVTTMWVNRPLEISQLGQLSLSSFWGR